MSTGRSVRIVVALCLALTGCGLIAINLHGYDRDPYQAKDHLYTWRPEDIKLSFAQTLAAVETIDRAAGSETERVSALMHAVHRRMVDYDGPAMRVRPADNWLIWGWSLLRPSFGGYEFIDPERALRRGLGLCGQQALILVGLLAERGFTAGRLRLRGHMATWVYADGKELILDPDFGTVLPFAIEHAEANLDEVRRLYYETSAQHFADPASKARALETIVASYAADNKRSGPGLADSAGGGALAIEHGLYILKWAIPLLLLAASAWLARGAVTRQPSDRGLPVERATR